MKLKEYYFEKLNSLMVKLLNCFKKKINHRERRVGTEFTENVIYGHLLHVICGHSIVINY